MTEFPSLGETTSDLHFEGTVVHPSVFVESLADFGKSLADFGKSLDLRNARAITARQTMDDCRADITNLGFASTHVRQTTPKWTRILLWRQATPSQEEESHER